MGPEAAEMDGEEGVVARVEAGEVVGDVVGDGGAARPARVPQLRQRLHDHLRAHPIQTIGSRCSSKFTPTNRGGKRGAATKEQGKRKLTSLYVGWRRPAEGAGAADEGDATATTISPCIR